MNRTKARRHVFCAVFSLPSQPECTADMLLSLYSDAREIEPDDYMKNIITLVCKHRDNIDSKIEKNLANWSFDRVSRVCLAAMRVAVCEMLYMEDIPASVSINEAIELVKEFEEEKSGAFVNGVLSGVMESL